MKKNVFLSAPLSLIVLIVSLLLLERAMGQKQVGQDSPRTRESFRQEAMEGRRCATHVMSQAQRLNISARVQRFSAANRDALRRELCCFRDWYNDCRPHMGLAGRTPNEVYFTLRPANGRPRIEPRKRWPRSSPCAMPRTLVAGQPGDRFTLSIDSYRGRRHLPIVSLRRAA